MSTASGHTACSKYCARQGSGSWIGMMPRCPLWGRGQRLHREIVLRVGPSGERFEPGAACERTKTFDGVFVAVLGVDGLAGAELDGAAGRVRLLGLRAGEMHFDPLAFAVVEGLMAEFRQVEVAREFAVDASE